MTNVRAIAEGPGENAAIVAHYHATFGLTNVTGTASGGTRNVGLENTMSQVTIHGSVLAGSPPLQHNWNGGAQAKSFVANTGSTAVCQSTRAA
jgi:hypothetical protein